MDLSCLSLSTGDLDLKLTALNSIGQPKIQKCVESNTGDRPLVVIIGLELLQPATITVAFETLRIALNGRADMGTVKVVKYSLRAP